LNRTDGALVRVITAIGKNENAQQAEARAVKFFGKQYFPV